MYWKICAPKDFVHLYLKKEAVVQAYQPLIQPLNGPNIWPVNTKEPILPPIIKRLAERPKKQRKINHMEKELKT